MIDFGEVVMADALSEFRQWQAYLEGCPRSAVNSDERLARLSAAGTIICRIEAGRLPATSLTTGNIDHLSELVLKLTSN